MLTHNVVDVHGAAAITGLSVSFLNKKRLTGGGPEYIKLGRRVVYHPDGLKSWLDENRRRSTSEVAR